MRINIILTSFLLSITAVFCHAQKLPNKQNNSLRSPENVKIDGRSLEWGNQFQAYNNATEISYTVSNDDEHLYVIIQAKSPDVISRITQGGITINIKKTNDKFDRKGKSITYPVAQQVPYFRLRKKKNIDEDTSAKAIDSVMQHNNALIGKSYKWIRVGGIPNIDTLISVYNDLGIKAMGLFNRNKVYTCEFSIDLKLLEGSVAQSTKYTYNIRINGASPVNFAVISATPGNEALMAQIVGSANMSGAQQSAPTDFTSEYTLISK